MTENGKTHLSWRLGFDIGGTFTDFVLVSEETQEMLLHKVLTTPKDPAKGALEGIKALIQRAGLTLGDLGQIIHGTTLATNAIIERKGAKLGLLTTEGFGDLLEMGSEQRYDIHDLFLSFPEPLVPRSRRIEIVERIDRDGNIITPLDFAQLQKQAQILVEKEIEALAICFIHSYANPIHEQKARDFVSEKFPNLPISISSDIHPRIREFERSATTSANAFVQPLMAAYVSKLEHALTKLGFTGRFHLIQSSGGLTASQTAREKPIRFLESGPAGGVQSTALVGRLLTKPDIISFDMGGTTAKAALIEHGVPEIAPMLEVGRVHRFKKGSGMPVYVPTIDMIEIGAGGGSIARVDALGLLKVGPDSAGADPGPACYGLGGKSPTVTDANLLLGYLDPSYFLGGRMTLNTGAANKAISELAEGLSLNVIKTAWGIYELVCESMAGAARVHIVEKGRDPRSYSMVAMGGAGPLHAARVAQKLGLKEVIVPAASGAASALGFLCAPVSFAVTRSMPTRLDNLDFKNVNSMLESLEKDSRAKLSEAGVTDEIEVRRQADLRLLGQMHEITIDLPPEAISEDNLNQVIRTFREEYQKRYTHLYENVEFEVLNWHVVCSGAVPRLAPRLNAKPSIDNALKGYREAYVPDDEAKKPVPVYDRYSLSPGSKFIGPAIIEEAEATTIVPSGCRLEVDREFNLRLNLDSIAPNPSKTQTVKTQDAEAIASDPIGLEIMWSRLVNIAEECWHAVIRTSFSLIIGEAQDFACEILDSSGRQIVHSPRAMPVFNLTLPIAVNAMIERFPLDTLKQGDVLITNDPWLCAGHLFDIAVAVPVFRHGVVVSFVGVVGHVTDIGGTKDSLNAREIFDEGFQIPSMKLFREGQPNADLFELLESNVRRADQVLGDLHALVAAAMTGAERIKSFMEEYSMNSLDALATVVQDRSEAAMRAAIAAVPDGIYENTIMGDGLDSALVYPVQVKISGEDISVTFDGAPPQLTRGGSNCTLTYTKAHATYPLKCIFSPDIPGNAGCYKPITVSAPGSSILNCDRPMSVNIRTRTGWYIGPNIYGALAPAVPDRVQAFTGLPSSALFYGIGPDGKVYSDHLFQGGGQGGSSHADGKSALLYPTSAANTSVEMFEARVPALVLYKKLITDSGGAGKYRGGLGQVIAARKLADDGQVCQVGMYPNGIHAGVNGLFDGKPGKSSRGMVKIGDNEVDVGIGGLSSLKSTDDVAELRIAGGSGFGDPLSRNYDCIAKDLEEGYVSREHAFIDYGCVLDAQGIIDREASDILRKNRRSDP